MTRSTLTLLALSACVALTACKNKPDPTITQVASADEATPREHTSEERGEAPQAKEDKAHEASRWINPLEKSRLEASASEATITAHKMTNGAKVYFTSEQLITGPEGNQPWHEGEALGMPVAFDSYVFPGGISFSMTTHDDIPRGGQRSAITLDVSSPGIAAVLDRMYLTLEPQSYFRYTYTTGPSSGVEATATITAEADFDPSTPEVHTETYTLTVDSSSYDVLVSDPVITHEFQ